MSADRIAAGQDEAEVVGGAEGYPGELLVERIHAGSDRCEIWELLLPDADQVPGGQSPDFRPILDQARPVDPPGQVSTLPFTDQMNRLTGVKGSQVQILSARPAFESRWQGRKSWSAAFFMDDSRLTKIALVDLVVTVVVTDGPTVGGVSSAL
jgi:hypothetical protein